MKAETMIGSTGRAGMTLLELVVSLTITGFVISAGYAALASVIDHRARADAVLDSASTTAGQRRMIIAWLSGAHVTVEQDGPIFRGLDGVYDHRPDDELTFLTSAATPLGGNETIVRLFVDRDSTTHERGLVASFREWPGNRHETLEINPLVTGLSLRYSSHQLGDHGWLPSWISTTLLPTGVELVLSADKGDTLPSLLALPIRVPFAAQR